MADLQISVAYALREEAIVVPLSVPPGTTILEAIQLSGILRRFPDISLEHQKVGIYGKLLGLTEIVRDGDRVEIYRPITVDPKEIRRLRAQKALLSGRAKSS